MSHNNAPREKGTAWEVRVVEYAQAAGLPWDRAPLRGTQDLLDVQGCLPDGWLVGCKALGRTANLADRLSVGMNEAQEARRRAVAKYLDKYPQLFEDLIPVQVVQRQGKSTGDAYVVMEYDDFLGLVVERRKWRANR